MSPLQTALGLLLSLLGASISIYWYIYWQRNYRGQLLTGGPYAVVRHPFYTGFTLISLGLALMLPVFETRLLLVITLATLSVFIPREEEELQARFGREYLDYMKRVKWRLVPHVY